MFQLCLESEIKTCEEYFDCVICKSFDVKNKTKCQNCNKIATFEIKNDLTEIMCVAYYEKCNILFNIPLFYKISNPVSNIVEILALDKEKRNNLIKN